MEKVKVKSSPLEFAIWAIAIWGFCFGLAYKSFDPYGITSWALCLTLMLADVLVFAPRKISWLYRVCILLLWLGAPLKLMEWGLQWWLIIPFLVGCASVMAVIQNKSAKGIGTFFALSLVLFYVVSLIGIAVCALILELLAF